MKVIPVLKRPLLKTEQKILSAIRANTDKWGWGLEISEICEMTGFNQSVVTDALKFLGSKKLVIMKVSAVANHIFFNDAEKYRLANS